jgi:hypothetical protein
MLVNREVILAKVETTYNTDPTPTGADNAVLVENVQCSPEGLRMAERPAVRSSIGTLRQIFAGMLRTITFDVEIKGSGAAGTAPELGVLLRGCGFDETVVVSTSVTYAPVSTGFESITLYYYQDGMLTKLTGCRGNVSFNLTAGGIAKASFTFTGHTATPTDTTIATPTYDSTVPVPFIGASFSIDSFAAVINAINFDMGNKLSMPSDANASDGYSEIFIVQRDPNGSFDPEKELVATEAFEANWRSGAEMAMQTGTIGSTAGNRFAFTWPAVSYRNITDAGRDGVRTYDATFGAAEDTTDDEVSIAFT